jgi:hypothetical protein
MIHDMSHSVPCTWELQRTAPNVLPPSWNALQLCHTVQRDAQVLPIVYSIEGWTGQSIPSFSTLHTVQPLTFLSSLHLPSNTLHTM